MSSQIPSARYAYAIAPLGPIFIALEQGGNLLGNGTWMNVGGNQAVTYGGATANSQTGGAPYDDLDGGQSCVVPSVQ
jgi:hypothetical protein